LTAMSYLAASTLEGELMRRSFCCVLNLSFEQITPKRSQAANQKSSVAGSASSKDAFLAGTKSSLQQIHNLGSGNYQ